MDTSNRRPPDRGRINQPESRDIYSQDRGGNNSDDRDIYTKNRQSISIESLAAEAARRPAAPRGKKKKKKRHLGLKILAVFLLLILFGWLAFEIWGKNWINENVLGTRSFPDDEQIAVMESGRDAEGITNIALFGLDTRSSGIYANAGSRSDSIMILSVDKTHHKIKISSIMRDCAVYIDSSKARSNQLYKINAAYNFGGPELAVKTLNKQLGLNIREYATVDFENMQYIIDAVDGIDIEITELERVNMNGSIKEQCDLLGIKDVASYQVTESGTVHMNGMQAVAFARIRYVPTVNGTSNDFGRTERQRLVMEKLFQKATNLDSLHLLGLGTKLVKYVETSLDIDNILSLSGILLRGDISFVQARYPRDEDLVGTGNIWISDDEVALNVDWDSIRESIQNFIYDDISPDASGLSEDEDD